MYLQHSGSLDRVLAHADVLEVILRHENGSDPDPALHTAIVTRVATQEVDPGKGRIAGGRGQGHCLMVGQDGTVGASIGVGLVARKTIQLPAWIQIQRNSFEL